MLFRSKTEALMLDDLYVELDMRRVPRLAGIPRFAFRQAFHQLWRWLSAAGRRDALTSFIEELGLVKYLGLFGQCWQLSRQQWTRPIVTIERTRRGAGLARQNGNP